jgi:DNA modification methylase
MTVELMQGDCLDLLPKIPDHSVDSIITDLPYGTTACSWDTVIPFAPMWEQVKRILKPRGVFVTTASQPFTSALVMSNLAWFKYEWIWRKNRTTGFLNANKRPMLQHENVVVFCENGGIFNPQMRKGDKHIRGGKHPRLSDNYGDFKDQGYESEEWYPTSVLDIKAQSESCVTFAQKPNRLITHPTQKPVELYSYLALTYTNPGDTVLDFCAGSGTTGVAAIKTGRNAILIEKRQDYYDIMTKRIETAQLQMRLPFEATA